SSAAVRVAATSRDAALRVQQRAWQDSIIAPRTAAEEHAAELRQPVEADTGDDPLGEVVHTPETVEDMGEE
ncbi:MAG: hypothetical protein ACK440_06595, partial [Sphingomonadaceae bacterium]